MRYLYTCVLIFNLFMNNSELFAEKKANNVAEIGSFGDWKAYVTFEKKEKVCYMVSLPKKQEGDFKKRGKVYAMITHRPSLKSFNVVSFHAGYKFPKNSKVTLSIQAGKHKKEFELFTDNETAWAISDSDDQEITKCLTKVGESLIIEGISSKGTKTKDTYSLKGSMKAYKAICEACKVLGKKN
ncbi:hypothetical protein IM40_01410 [Candidatus Paracaedimonas acanthamoebae]|nr:hypothetical protein IM40_01410 [Candidatus Paracaedimonas acanthamoebae]